MSKCENKRLGLNIPFPFYDLIEQVARKTGQTVNGFIKSSLFNYLKEKDLLDGFPELEVSN